MAQILDPIPADNSSYTVCCYVNATNHIQIARITNIPNWYFERVVFPGQRLVFETLPDAHLEIHTGMMASSILSDKIPCDRLCIDETNTLSATGLLAAPIKEKTDNKRILPAINNKTLETAESFTMATV